ncbi:amidohydrolase family protein [Nocardia yamanashiensis]|uniref:amidohydrolase family protein n=1 Tax=Nocardia yamanashiensis TaxID=209247 RepID=UPI000829FA4F|nr:amidohydrolase family protein [Nocardia yamanashiensis]
MNDDYVAGLRTRLGLPGIIDIHTHFMPDPVMRKVWDYFDSAGPLIGRAWPIEYRDEEQVRLKTLRGFGVRAFTSMVYPHKPDMAAWLNGWTADFAARTPDCLHTATFYPEPGAGEYVRAALDGGTRVFKVHVQVGQFDPGDRLLDEVWGLIQDAGIPVVIHCGSGPTPGKFTGPGPIRALLRRFPRLQLIIAHLGAPEYTDFLDIAAEHDAVLLDTTMNFTDFFEAADPFPASEYPRLRDFGDRILFGSDFPNIPYPYGHALHALERLNLGDDWLRRVCHDNAARVFGLG